MIYFKQNFHTFFKELAANNHKEWFDLHRKEYEKEVKETFYNFIQDFIEVLRQDGIDIHPDAKQAIFRINKDIRFSKDKTPYKLFASALLSPTGRKNMEYPGFYIECSPEKVSIYSGVYKPNTAQILKIRHYILDHSDKLNHLINASTFKKKFGEIQGKLSVRVPKEFKEKATEQPLLWLKQWYIVAHLSPESMLQDDFMTILQSYIYTALPLQKFFVEALD